MTTRKRRVKGNIVLGSVVKTESNNVNSKEKYISEHSKYMICGLCDEFEDFYITINNICNDTEFSKGTQYIAKVNNGEFMCELDVCPTTLDYCFVQNIDEYINDKENIEPIVPEILCLTAFCDLTYIKNTEHIFEGLDETISEYIK